MKQDKPVEGADALLHIICEFETTIEEIAKYAHIEKENAEQLLEAIMNGKIKYIAVDFGQVDKEVLIWNSQRSKSV